MKEWFFETILFSVIILFSSRIFHSHKEKETTEEKEDFQTRWYFEEENQLPLEIGKIIARRTDSVTIIRFRFETKEQRERFFNGTLLSMNEKVTCFDKRETGEIVLLLEQYQLLEVQRILDAIKKYGGSVIKTEYCQQGGNALWDTYKHFREEEPKKILGHCLP